MGILIQNRHEIRRAVLEGALKRHPGRPARISWPPQGHLTNGTQRRPYRFQLENWRTGLVRKLALCCSGGCTQDSRRLQDASQDECATTCFQTRFQTRFLGPTRFQTHVQTRFQTRSLLVLVLSLTFGPNMFPDTFPEQ